MSRTPAEVTVDQSGKVPLPMGLLAEAGLNPGDQLLAYSDGDGRIVLRRHRDAVHDLLATGALR